MQHAPDMLLRRIEELEGLVETIINVTRLHDMTLSDHEVRLRDIEALVLDDEDW